MNRRRFWQLIIGRANGPYVSARLRGKFTGVGCTCVDLSVKGDTLMLVINCLLIFGFFTAMFAIILAMLPRGRRQPF
ncbi:MAG: hypothetical protein KDA87_07510 [Planctomycetales bacterium]|nr:hypothetical protein [Planctomycetales bacterium]